MAKTKNSSASTTGSARANSTQQKLFAGGVAPFYLAILAVTILVGISAVMVVSASSAEAVLLEATTEQGAQATLASFAEGANNLFFIFIGATFAFIISRIDYRTFAPWSFPAIIIVLLLLVYTFFWGVTV
ncbi:MAG: hypothetical protein FWE87_03955, partial [Coriobacteriia bacterium]|nr:hypothetical protein [Coriobacteriia bacterium]